MLVEGALTISRDLDEIVHFATRSGARCQGADRADQFGARNGVEGALFIRLHMDRLFALDEISDQYR